jgi:radical SAM superfamily enzyme YgiQ (UPF0313 family)
MPKILNKKQKSVPDIWLCDLTHTQQTIASEAMPLGIGMIAAYCQEKFGKKINFRIFKKPDDLIKNFLTKPPRVIGFSNNLWNSDLSYQLAKEIKRLFPSTIIVFGGPNYPIEPDEREEFMKERKEIDFYIFGEGEESFYQLVKNLTENNFDIVNAKKVRLPNCYYFLDGNFIVNESGPRLDFKNLPSPYLAGLMDEFFKDNFMPLVQTVRGCPFCCSYCCEGQGYFNRVYFREAAQVEKEIEYIAKRSKGNKNLNMADSNFGQYPQDLATAQAIARAQEKYNYPQYVHVAAGKSNKEGVMEVAKITKGAIRLSASVQSTDSSVLANIKRVNVPLETLVRLAKVGKEIGSNTYSEIILALPGDTKKAHLKSIEDMVNMDLSFIRCFTLMIFMGADLGTKETRRKFGMKTKFRILPRCFGAYQFGKRKIYCAEMEEVCVANNTLSFKDYLDCRVFSLTLEIFYNDHIMAELFSFLKNFNIKPYDVLIKIHQMRQEDFSQALLKLYNDFLSETKSELWDSSEKLGKFAKNGKNIKKYLNGKYGSNLIFKYKTLAYIKHIREIHNIIFDIAKKLINKGKAKDKKSIFLFLDELKKYSLFQKDNLFNVKKKYRAKFFFDIGKMAKNNFNLPMADIKLSRSNFIEFKRSQQQIGIIKSGLEQFGTTNVGLARILSRVHVKKIYRTAEIKK